MSKVGNKLKRTVMTALMVAVGTSMFVGSASLTACVRGPGDTFQTLKEVKSMGLIVVPNKNRVDVMDLQINRVIETLQTDDRPNSIAVSPDGRQILVTNQNSGTVSVFLRRDNDTFQSLNPVGSGLRPIGVAFNPNTQYSEAYVAYEGDSKLLVLDTRDRNASPKITQVISLSDTLVSSPKNIVVSPTGNRIYVTDSKNGRIITLARAGVNFNRSFSPPFATNGSGIELSGIIIDPETERLFIANEARSDVFVFNGNSNQVMTPINLQDNQIVGQRQVGPRNLVLYNNPERGIKKIYVTGHNASIVSVIDPTNMRLLKNIPLAQNTLKDSYNPVGIAVGTNASKEDVIYVTNTSGLTVSLIDPVTDTLNRNISTTVSAGAQDPLGEIVTVAPVK